jgi:hypothetical protein
MSGTATLSGKVIIIRILMAVVCMRASVPIYGAENQSYLGVMQIPVSLITEDGVKLDKGRYELKIEPHGNSYTLVFSTGGQVKAAINSLPKEDSRAAAAHIPLVGTHYLRSTSDPVLTAQERQYSKTGRAQYEEEERPWKATLRVYKSLQEQAVYFVFQGRETAGRWNRVNFRLAMAKAE